MISKGEDVSADSDVVVVATRTLLLISRCPGYIRECSEAYL